MYFLAIFEKEKDGFETVVIAYKGDDKERLKEDGEWHCRLNKNMRYIVEERKYA